MAGAQGEPADGDAERDLAGDDREKGAGRLRQRERAGRDRDHGEAIEDQRGGVIGKAFALEHDQDAAGDAEPARDRDRRHRVGRSDDGAEQEADVPGQADQVVRGGRDHRRREDDAADGEHATLAE